MMNGRISVADEGDRSSLCNRISRPPSVCSSAMSSQTRRILEQLEKAASPVKDAHRFPAVRVWDMDRWLTSSGRDNPQLSGSRPGRDNPQFSGSRPGVAPPKISLGSPSRVQILSSNLCNVANKPYWRRPLQNQRSSDVCDTSPHTSTANSSIGSLHQAVLKGSDGKRINNVFSARFSDAELDVSSKDTSARLSSVAPVSANMLKAPAHDFLGIKSGMGSLSKFSFSKPLTRLSPSTPLKRSHAAAVPMDISSAINTGVTNTYNSEETSNAVNGGKNTYEEMEDVSSSLSPTSSKSSDSPQSTALLNNNSSTIVGHKESESVNDGREKNWSCPSCFVSNSGPKCVCCGTANPKASEKWSCGECFVQSTGIKCIACGNPKPGTTTASSSSSVFGDRAFKPVSNFTPTIFGNAVNERIDTKASEKWSCGECFVQSTGIKCIACGNPKPGTTTASSSSSVFGDRAFKPVSNFTPTIFGNAVNERVDTKAPSQTSLFGNQNAQLTVVERKAWNCTICFVHNGADSNQCVNCDAPRPGNKYKPVQFGLPTAISSTNAMVPLMTGANESPSKKAVTFPDNPVSSTKLITPVSTTSSSVVPVFNFTPSVQFGLPTATSSAPPSTSADTVVTLMTGANESPSKKAVTFPDNPVSSTKLITPVSTTSSVAPVFSFTPSVQFGLPTATSSAPPSTSANAVVPLMTGANESSSKEAVTFRPPTTSSVAPVFNFTPSVHFGLPPAIASTSVFSNANASMTGANELPAKKSVTFPSVSTSSVAPIFNFTPSAPAPFSFSASTSATVLPTTFTFGAPVANSIAPSSDPPSNPFQFGSNTGDNNNPFAWSSSSSAANSRRMLTANRKRGKR